MRRTGFLSNVILTCALITALPASGHDMVWPGEKLAAMYPSAESFEQKNLYISSSQKTIIEGILNGPLPAEDVKPSVYFAIVRESPATRPRKAAVMMFVDAQGRSGTIEMGIVVNGTGSIEAVHIFENHETMDLRDAAFLGQFTGKKAEDPFVIGTDLSPQTFDREVAQAISSGVRRGLVIINELFKRP